MFITEVKDNFCSSHGCDFIPVKPWWLKLLSVLRRGSVVVDLLFIVTPIVGCFVVRYFMSILV